jgi:hypothetical protein
MERTIFLPLLILVFVSINNCVVTSFRFGNVRIHSFSAKRSYSASECKNSLTLASSKTSIKPFDENLYVKLPNFLYEAAEETVPVTSFLKSFRLFSTELGRNHQKLSQTEKYKLISLIGLLFQEFTTFQLASLLSYLSVCGFSASHRREHVFLKNIQERYLQLAQRYIDLSVVQYFKALSKLGFDWDLWNKKEKEAALGLFEETSKLELFSSHRLDFVVAISKLGIPWTSMSDFSKNSLLQNMANTASLVDPYKKAKFIAAFAAIKFLHFTYLPQPILLEFLDIAKECLELQDLEEQSNLRGRQVYRLY